MKLNKYPGIWINERKSEGLVPVFLATKEDYYYHNRYSLSKFGNAWKPVVGFTRVAGEAIVGWRDE